MFQLSDICNSVIVLNMWKVCMVVNLTQPHVIYHVIYHVMNADVTNISG